MEEVLLGLGIRSLWSLALSLFAYLSKLTRWGSDTTWPGWACSTLTHLGIWGVLVSWSQVRPDGAIEFGAHSAPVLTIEMAPADASPPATVPPLLELQVAVTPASAQVDWQEFVLDPATSDEVGEPAPLPREVQPARVEHATESEEISHPVEGSVSQLPQLPAKQLHDSLPPHPTVATTSVPASEPQSAVRLPEFIENRPPVYPHQAVEYGWYGTVWLRLVITPDGRVAELNVDQSSGHALLDAAAVSAVRQWRAMSRPGENSLVVRLPVRFELSSNTAP